MVECTPPHAFNATRNQNFHEIRATMEGIRLDAGEADRQDNGFERRPAEHGFAQHAQGFGQVDARQVWTLAERPADDFAHRRGQLHFRNLRRLVEDSLPDLRDGISPQCSGNGDQARRRHAFCRDHRLSILHGVGPGHAVHNLFLFRCGNGEPHQNAKAYENLSHGILLFILSISLPSPHPDLLLTSGIISARSITRQPSDRSDG